MSGIIQLLTTDWSLQQVLLCLVVFLFTFHWYRRPKNFPPGPRGIPVFGAVPWLGKFVERDFRDWSKGYGPVMSVRMGRNDWVILNDYESIQEAFVSKKHQFAGRPEIPLLDGISQGHGISFIDATPLWKSQRRFAIKTLKDLGFAKGSMEERIQQEAFCLNKAILEHGEKPFNITKQLTCAAANNICGVVFAKRFEYNDERFQEVVHRIIRGLSDPSTNKAIGLLLFAPILIHLPFFKRMEKKFLKDFDYTFEFHKEHISEHKETFDSENHRDFVDAFLAEMSENKDGTFTDKQLLMVVRDLLLAGTESTSSTLRWALILLIHFPHAQKRLYQEICTVVGEEGTVKMSHKSSMPYTSSFLQELLRFRTLAPMALPHMATEDVNLFGYNIPKGTQVSANLWAVHNDPKLFSEPEKFKPDRFLDDNGKIFHSKHVVSFSVGSRHCVGEQLARMELFIILVSLVQKFEFHASVNGEMPELYEGSIGLVLEPLPFKMIAKAR